MNEITLFKETEKGNEAVLTVKKDKEFYKYLFDEYFEKYDSKGLETIHSLLKKNDDGTVIYFEIQHWIHRPYDKFDYTYMIFDDGDNVIDAVADGGLRIGKIYRIREEVTGFLPSDFYEDYFCYADDLEYECIDCGNCEE